MGQMSCVVREGGRVDAFCVSADWMRRNGEHAFPQGLTRAWRTRHPLTPGGLAPEEKGLVVIDHDARWVGWHSSSPCQWGVDLMLWLGLSADCRHPLVVRGARSWAAGEIQGIESSDGVARPLREWSGRKGGRAQLDKVVRALRSAIGDVLEGRPLASNLPMFGAAFLGPWLPLGWSATVYWAHPSGYGVVDRDDPSERAFTDAWARFAQDLATRGFRAEESADAAWDAYTGGQGLRLSSFVWAQKTKEALPVERSRSTRRL